ncbi:MAG TPA: DUF2520 domain-containing protein [Acidimicrobiales bacterium]|nr:DUF2520 domain-containing protein [Acidimicrobiales bacterium]
MTERRFRVIGPGRAGGAFRLALEKVGWVGAPELARLDDLSAAAADVDLVLVTVPDAVVAGVASSIAPSDHAVVAHVAGSLGLDALAPHPRRAVIHPLVTLPEPDVGARRLLDSAWFALADGGDPIANEVVDAFGGHAVSLADDPQARAIHHAACCVAANHVVALLAQVERLAATVGVPREAYLALARGALENVAELGATAALTGPVARGDQGTIKRHRAALDAVAPRERALYDALVAALELDAACK